MKISDEMLYLCAPLAEEMWLQTIPNDDEIPYHQFSMSFERKMRRLIKQQKRSNTHNKLLQTAKRVAIVAIATITVLFSSLMTVEAYREKFIEIVREVFYELTHFNFVSTWEGEPVLGEITLEYVPQGMEEVRREIDEDVGLCVIYFSGPDDNRFKISQQLLNDEVVYDVIIDTENACTEIVSIGSYEAELTVKDDIAILVWRAEPYVMSISGELSSDDVVKIAESIGYKK